MTKLALTMSVLLALSGAGHLYEALSLFDFSHRFERLAGELERIEARCGGARNALLRLP